MLTLQNYMYIVCCENDDLIQLLAEPNKVIFSLVGKLKLWHLISVSVYAYLKQLMMLDCLKP